MDQIAGANTPPQTKQILGPPDTGSGKSGSSGLSDIADIAKLAMMFMNRGGRAGFADGGSPGANPGETTYDLIKRRADEAAAAAAARSPRDDSWAGQAGRALGNLSSADTSSMHNMLVSQDRSNGVGLTPATMGSPGRPDYPPAYVVPPSDVSPANTNSYSPAATLGDSGAAAPLSIVRPPIGETAVLDRPAVSLAHPVSTPTIADATISLAHPVSTPDRSPLAPTTSPIPQSRPAAPGLGMADINKAGIGVNPPLKDMGTIKEVPIGNLANAPTPPPSNGVAGPTTSTAGQGPAVPKGSMADNLMNGLMQRGYSEVAAKGILMNLNSESSLNTSASGDSGNALGLAQWNGPRKADLIAFAKAQGKSPNDYNVQLDFLDSEMKGKYSSTYDAVQNAKTPGEAAVAFLNGFEKPAERYRREREALYTGQNPGSFGSGVSNFVHGVEDEAGKAGQTLGSIIHNPDGSFNKDALLSILSGLGTMASSPSRFLGTAILQGIGGGAQTYMGQEARRQDITGKEIANSKTSYEAYMQAKALNPALANVSYEDWAKGITEGPGPQGTMPYSGGSNGTSSGTSNWQNDINDLKTKIITYDDGTKVNAAQDRGYLQKWNSDHAQAAVYNPMIAKQIEANNAILAALPEGRAIDVNGNQVPQPGAIKTADTAGLADTQIKGRDEYTQTINKTIPSLNAATQNLDKLVEDYQKFDPGAGTNALNGWAGLVKVFDPNNQTRIEDLFDNPDTVEIARKRAASYIASQFNNLPGAPAAGLDVLSQISPNADLQPEAVRQIIVQAKATIDQQKAMADEYLKQGSPRDVAGFQREWLEKNDLSKFYAEEDKKIPALGLRNQVLPPKEQLEVGKTYNVPGHGPMTWDGTEFN
jgi:hypothetical protein